MTDPVRIALGQMCSGLDPEENINTIAQFAAEARAAGAGYLQVPEMSVGFAGDRAQLEAIAEPEVNNRQISRLSDVARENGIVLHVGSLAVSKGNGRFANRSLLFGRSGRLLGQYDKVHLFDADVPDQTKVYRESATYDAGDALVIVDLASEGIAATLGLSICFDVRFGEHYLALAQKGAKLMAVPAAFTQPTGEAHWEVLLRARAIETGSFVLAAAQAGDHANGRSTHGHSMIVDPWGRILAEKADREPGLLLADLDLDAVTDARRRLPVLDMRQAHSLSINHKVAG
ncbi:MAG: carbon-nitrogen hydrolase family protein [Hyphomicrobiaceae bacterium]|nr:carbon-nitrogen hydrolase family protein [Hyphomicrobiaceae bacterium]MCC0023851.1 carbon-nitrogen hydrolase family protein [Hyphomicrobiaceae bacterium]